MPNMDGTGPRGKGPRTGRGLGNCSPVRGRKRIKRKRRADKDELIREAMEALEYISRKASHGNLYGDEARDMCCDIGPVAQEVLARLREKEGWK